MSHDIANRASLSAGPSTLGQVYRRLGALHVTLAEADRVDEGLRRRTLDRLMDMLELIEEAAGPPQPKRQVRTSPASPLSHSPLQEHDLVALTTDLLGHGLIAGDVGTVVFVHADGAAYEVELMTADGKTIAVETLEADQVEPVAGEYILHVRKHASV